MSSNAIGIQVTAENAEEILESALQEEKAQSGQVAEETEAPPEEPQETKDAEEAPKDLEIGQKEDESEADAEAPLSMDEVFKEWSENGQLSDETNAALVDRLTKAGFDNPQGIIAQYISGAEATVAGLRNTAFQAAGGEEQYSAMVEWARENLSPAQIAAYDQSVSDPNMIDIAVRGLRAQFEQSGAASNQRAKSPRVDPGAKPDGTVNGTVPVPRSNVQVSDLVSDPRYARDPGYRADVDAAISKAIERGLI